ncbi:S-layer homology domain-containing protein [Paenibacillus sp. alder61]|uniref:S-layer homology domain-containing protein n=1 Tax=Paenibacillus sp. alder61 TaxID=2862948 RepID=UPI001CD6CE41|nr:S-layer homology domain-containing protein [Paenibacillus sp. alder61]MCA1295218.1 S-layer homology domain-containing protein [Paenibacillus sp. alder61]
MKRRKSTMAILLAGLILIGQIGLYGIPALAGSHADPQGAVPPMENGWVLLSAPEQLAYINRNQEQYLDKQIRLVNDIDLTGVTWVPFGGNDFAPFSGIFDGQGHTITGLNIEGDTRLNVGFFGEANGSIRNLSLKVNITGGSITGGVAGYLSGGSIVGAYTEGNVTSLVPRDPNKVTSTGGITGILGHARIERSSSSASVTASWGFNMYGGGISGYVFGASILDSFFTGQIRNVADAGNSHVYTSGIGAYFSGTPGNENTVRNTYSRGRIHPENPGWYTGRSAIAGYTNTTGIYSSYFDKETSMVSVGVDSTYNSGPLEAAGLTTAEMKQRVNYIGWDFEHTWNIHANVNDGYPYLRPRVLTEEIPFAVQGEPYSLMLAGFDGTHAGLTWSATGLPDGLNLNPSGEIHGTPTSALSGNSSYDVIITATDEGGATVVRSFQLDLKTMAPPLENVSVQPGAEIGTTAITVTPLQTGATLAFVLDRTDAEPPLYEDTLPPDAVYYVPGSDIPGMQPGQTVDLYEIDARQRIKAWHRLILEADHIRQFIPVNGIWVEPSDLTLMVGDEPVKLNLILEPETATNKEVTWVSADPAVAEVNNLNGEVLPVKPGQTVITATASSGLTAKAAITVQPATGSVTGAVYSTVSSSVYDKELIPLAGASVSIGGGSVLTNIQGDFKLDEVPVGPQTLTIEASGFAPFVQRLDVQANQILDTGIIVLAADKTPEPEPQPDPEPHEPSPSSPPEPGTNAASGRSAPAAESNARSSLAQLTINHSKVWVAASRETTTDGQTAIRLKPDASALARVFTANHEVLMEYQADDTPAVYLDLPGKFLVDMLKRADTIESGYSITFKVNGTGFQLPLHWLNGSRPALDPDSVVTIGVRQPAPTIVGNLSAVLAQRGAKLIESPVAFSVEINGQPTEESIPNGQANRYWNKTIALPASADPVKSTVVWVDGQGGMHFTPSVFHNDPSEATIYSQQYGLFAVISSQHTFEDIAGHWAKDEIELMANKWIVQGRSDGFFSPDAHMTRAELAALLVRSLGLTDSVAKKGSPFADISPDAWYAGAVRTALERGLFTGDHDGMFRPDAWITREELAVVVARALSFNARAPQPNSAALGAFSDANTISAWAAEPVAKLTESGLLQGTSAACFSPRKYATRAESAVMLKRMLQYLKFINS